MLDTLRRIVTEVSSAPNLDEALGIIVHRIKQAMAAEACSVFLTDLIQKEHVLMATEGLKPESVLMVRVPFNSGLVSLVAKRAEPLNIENAKLHAKYVYFEESGEDEFNGFLGVPIIHHRKVLGVIVVQQHDVKKFDESNVTLLVTIAAQLAGAIAHAEVSGDVSSFQVIKNFDSRPLNGLPGASGVALGTAVVLFNTTDIMKIPDRPVDNPEDDIELFLSAVNTVKQDISDLSQRLEHVIPAEDRALFDAYNLMLSSDTMIDATVDRIKSGNWAEGAWRETIEEHVKIFNEMEDAYLRERADDVRDLGLRVLTHMMSDDLESKEIPDNAIIVGATISASMLTDIPIEKLVGVISSSGSLTSHVAILARAMNIPAVMGVVDLPIAQIDRVSTIVDGYNGKVYFSPSTSIVTEYQQLANEEKELSKDLQELSNLPAETQDGIRIHLYANSGLTADIQPMINSGAEGIGLYRTEFPFMVRNSFPGEEEQKNIYQRVLEPFSPRPVTLRTLDIGGDKSLPYFPIIEENPFLGWRGIRVTLDHPEIFLVQVRAMLRASVGLDNLNILLPMISNLHEIDEAKALINQAYDELLEEGEAITMPKIGAMIEVPSAIFQAAEYAKRVDFLSIGTNDLTQYILAIDRNNPNVADLYDPFHPSVLMALLQIVDAARSTNTAVSVCGELAGDPLATLLLLGMEMDSLSMSSASLLKVKWVIRNFTILQAKKILHEALLLHEAKEIREYLKNILIGAGLGGLLRAGKT
ncbi:MAG: phosphoenolpyruvate--protein phosphotransferase [Gammaproteobacteria bacterium]